MIYKVIGVDKETAEYRELICEYDTEREAQNEAFEKGIAVERVEIVKPAKGKPEKKKKAPKPVQHISADDSFDDNIANPTKKRSDRADYNRQVGIVAMGVFLGLLVFSCASPLIIIGVLGVLRALGRNLGS